MKSKAIVELFPRRFPCHRLTADNTLAGIVPGDLFTLEHGRFFNKTAWKMREGWTLRGWGTPPYAREDAVAIVFEKETPVNEDGSYLDRKEPGIYWIHGPRGMQFIV